MACCCEPCTLCPSKFMQVDIDIVAPKQYLLLGASLTSCKCSNDVAIQKSVLLPLLAPDTWEDSSGRWGFYERTSNHRILGAEWPCKSVPQFTFLVSISLAYCPTQAIDSSCFSLSNSGGFEYACDGNVTAGCGGAQITNNGNIYLEDHPYTSPPGSSAKCLTGTKTYRFVALGGRFPTSGLDIGTFTVTFF